jgi:nucleotide-binding universal stress UspA family protein
VTVLHFETGQPTPSSWQRQFGAAIAPMSGEDTVIPEIVHLGEPYGVDVKRVASRIGTSGEAIFQQIKRGEHNLVVMGVSPRPGDRLSFGAVAVALFEHAECSLLFVADEHFAPPTEAES